MKEQILEELEVIRQSAGGFLRPNDVVEFARSSNTELHKHFTWDDTKAAEEYRLAEARALIRVVVITHGETNEKIRAFVSLNDDRNSKGGYRAMVDILDDKLLTEKMLEEALAELERFRHKYNTLRALSELSPVFNVVDKALTTAGAHRQAL